MQKDERVAGEVQRRERRPRGKTEGGGELGNVQDRLGGTVDGNRRDDRAARLLPATCARGAVANVDGLPDER